jgi:hypothetical protein
VGNIGDILFIPAFVSRKPVNCSLTICVLNDAFLTNRFPFAGSKTKIRKGFHGGHSERIFLAIDQGMVKYARVKMHRYPSQSDSN